MILDRTDLDIHPFCRKHYRSPAHGQLSDAAGDQAAADHDPLSGLPRLESHESTHYNGELTGKLLNHSVDEAGQDWVVARQHLVELRFGDFFQRHITEWILSMFL